MSISSANNVKNEYVLTARSVKREGGALDATLLREISAACNATAFVETGTYLGETSAVAAAIFQEVHTIELSVELAQKAMQRFCADDRIHVYQGDSAEVLDTVIPRLANRSVFWLDGHYSEGITAKGKSNTPILDEIKSLARHGATDHVLLIDDISLFRGPQDTADAPPSLHGYPSLLALCSAIMTVNPEYKFAVVGDVAIALPPISHMSVSPFIQACTISRLFDCEEGDDQVDIVCDAEQAIGEANARERECVAQWLSQSASREQHGLGAHFRLWQGLVLLHEQKPEAALDEFEKALELGLTHWRLAWYIAQAAHRAGLSDKARKSVEAVRRNAPQFGLPAEYEQYRGTRAANDLDALRQAGLWQDGQPLRLHLGCGEQLFPGYINIDYPQSEHNVMAVKPEVYADITKIDMPANSVDEIRLHHVFEHFNRVTALAMLIRWHRWLKPGGKLHIETPDLAGSVKTLASAAPYKNKMSVVRHLAGDQAASWAYHLDHWFPERYQRTLEKLGFASVQTASQTWPHEPHLSNVTAVACKLQDRSEADQLAAADELLWDSIVSPSEQTTFDVWRQQLRTLVSAGALQPSGKFNPPAMNIGANHVAALQQNASQLPLAEIYGFNQSDRDKWVAGRAATVPTGSRVLDIGAGTCPYRSLFAHCDYRTHDFMQYEGVKLGGTAEYGKIDYVSDVAAIPAPDNFFDVILCTEVLEHVPEPIEALREMSRLLRPGGRLFVSAPLGSGLHQLPYHYYGGYTPGWYQHFGTTFGLDIKEISPNGGFFKLLAQECARVAWTLPSHQHLHGEHLRDVQQLFGDLLPRYLFGLEEQQMISQFTVGYHVEAVKSRDVSAIQAQIDQDSTNVALYAEAALAAVASGNLGDSLRYYEDACELNIDDSSLANLHFYFQTTKAGK